MSVIVKLRGAVRIGARIALRRSQSPRQRSRLPHAPRPVQPSSPVRRALHPCPHRVDDSPRSSRATSRRSASATCRAAGSRARSSRRRRPRFAVGERRCRRVGGGSVGRSAPGTEGLCCEAATEARSRRPCRAAAATSSGAAHRGTKPQGCPVRPRLQSRVALPQIDLNVVSYSLATRVIMLS